MAFTRSRISPEYSGTDGTLAATILRLRIESARSVLVKIKDASPAAALVAVQQGAVLTALTESDSFATGYGVPLAAGDSYTFHAPGGNAPWYLLMQGNTATCHVEVL